MTSKLTKEHVIALIVEHAYDNELADALEYLLAAMDSEPVAWRWQYREQWHVTSDPLRAKFVAKDGDVAVLPLYRHVQTALIPYAWSYDWARCVTCEGPQDFEPVIEREPPPQWAIDEGRVKNLITLYRTAQPAPVVPDKGHKWSYRLIHPENCQCIECRSARLNGVKS